MLLTPQEAADRLKVSRRMVYYLIEAGALPSVRISDRVIRIQQQDLNSYIKSRRYDS